MGQVGAVGRAGDRAVDRPESEPLAGVIARLTDAAVVQHQRLAALAFQEQFAIIGPGQGAAQHGQRPVAVQPGVEWGKGGGGVFGTMRKGHAAFLVDDAPRRLRGCP
jgi:hypothetical protein